MKRIAIIGSESFLARNFIKYSVDSKLGYQFELYDVCNKSECQQFPYKKIDFGNSADVNAIDYSVDVIMVFIGKTGTTSGFENYQDFIEVNEIALINILKCYVDNNSTARIIYPSSRLIFKSKDTGLIDETSNRECKSIYAVTKLAAENYLKVYSDSFGINYVIIRICTPIGSLLDDYGNYGTFEIFKNQAVKSHEVTVFGDGLQRKTFTSIQDICKAFSLVVEKEKIAFSDYNLGGQELSLLDIAKGIASEYQVPLKHIPWPEVYKKVDGGSVVFDSSRFDNEFYMKYEVLQ